MRSKSLFHFILIRQYALLNRVLSRNYNNQAKISHLGVNTIVERSSKVVYKTFTPPFRLLSDYCNDNTALRNNDDLVIFNSHKKFALKKVVEKTFFKKNKNHNGKKPLSVILKYLNSEENIMESPVDDTGNSTETEGLVNFPYCIRISDKDGVINEEEINNVNKDETSFKEQEGNNHNYFPENHYPQDRGQWMNDYEQYTEENEETADFDEWHLDYGTPNPKEAISKIPCGGCGALLHCQDPSIPGYLPSEIFLQCKNKDLMRITCQRCHFMKHYNTALAINVDQTLYPKLLAKIKDETALMLLMVDLTDFPCSIWPGILDIIGKKRPLFIIGNKVDLLWGDRKGWIDHVAKSLRTSFPPNANIKHVSLISAKTGFGVEELINKLHNIWKYKGDVYLIGCTNVGKSTLFNALLQSDYCKVKAVDLLQRATTSPWPGTTLNLLKFPILRPEGWRLYLRTLRLINDRNKASYEKKMRKQLMMLNKEKVTSPPQLIGHIGRTFTSRSSEKNIQLENNFTFLNKKQINNEIVVGSGLDPNDPDFLRSKWLYDTPGVVHTDQILDLLTTEELMLTIPKNKIEPRTFLIKPNWTIFIAGLARLDYSEGSAPIRLTVFSSSLLPVTICNQIDADQVYNDLLGTEHMLVPQGSQERLKHWPHLKMGQKLSLIGNDSLTSCADIILSSAGWISVTVDNNQICKFIPWTPLARGVHVRTPSLLPNAVNLRGKKSRRTPAYGKTKPFLD